MDMGECRLNGSVEIDHRGFAPSPGPKIPLFQNINDPGGAGSQPQTPLQQGSGRAVSPGE
jgi:hypothetical protein